MPGALILLVGWKERLLSVRNCVGDLAGARCKWSSHFLNPSSCRELLDILVLADWDFPGVLVIK